VLPRCANSREHGTGGRDASTRGIVACPVRAASFRPDIPGVIVAQEDAGMAIVMRDGEAGKVCNRCGEWKSVMEFSVKRASLLRGGDGYLGTCKSCDNARQRAEKRMTPEELQAKRAKPPTITERDGVAGKTCTRCDVWKPLIGFSPRMEHGKPTGDGYQNICKACRTFAEMERYYLDPEYGREMNRVSYQIYRERRIAEMRTYRELNRDRINAQKREYWNQNKEYINELRRQDRLDNPQKYRASNLRYAIRNREKLSARSRLFRLRNPDRIRRFNQDYRKRYPEKFTEIANRRRVQEMNAPGSHTVAEWEKLKHRYNNTCLCCGRREPEIKLTRDHVIPLTKGGSDYIDNIQPLCRSCNSSKNVKIIDYRPKWLDPDEQ
jgi:5-methylcytosine-specific restriction endonuclease McrA